MAEGKKHLSFNSLRDMAAFEFGRIEDHRGESVKFLLRDVCMSGLGMMFFQDPSLLAFQRRLGEAQERHNLESLFGVKEVPSDTQMRDILDPVESQSFGKIFKKCFSRLQRAKYLERFRVLGDLYNCPIDGSGYFSSESIQCPHCLKATSSSGNVRYSHQILQAAIVHPDEKQVIPLCPEEISNEDGATKNDCEMNAAKRLLKRLRKEHPFLNFLINGDGLYPRQPLIELIITLKMHYIFVVKEDLKNLWEWFNEQSKLRETDTYEQTRKKGELHRYEWLNGVRLNSNTDAPLVNMVTFRIIRDGKETYKNSWVTDLPISAEDVVELVKVGRARWKVENECFNTLKNHGYHIEHNYGHGKENLSFNFFLLNLLAFLWHQIFELSDILFQKCRTKHVAKYELRELLRSAIKLILFRDWEHLLRTCLGSG